MHLPLVPRPDQARWRVCKFAKLTQPAMEPETAWANLYSHAHSQHHTKAKLEYVRAKYGNKAPEVDECFAQMMDEAKKKAERAKKAKDAKAQKAKETQNEGDGEDQEQDSGGVGVKRHKRPNGQGPRRRAEDAGHQSSEEAPKAKATRTTFQRGCETAFRTAWKCVHRHHSQADYESQAAA